MSVTEQISVVIPSGDKDREALRNGVKEIDMAMTRRDAEGDYIKDSIAALSEKFDIPKKFIRKMAIDYHKAQYDKKAQENDEYSALYETIME